MKRVLLLSTLISFAACAPQEWHKPGETVPMVTADKIACGQEADMLYPEAVGLDVSVLGDNVHARTKDMNKKARKQHFKDCMRLKGWDLR